MNDLRIVISVWLARLQAAFFNGLSALAGRLLGLVFPKFLIGRRGVPVHPATHRPARRHSADEQFVPGMWLMAPRVTTAAWAAGAVLILARHLHLAHHAVPQSQDNRLSHGGAR